MGRLDDGTSNRIFDSHSLTSAWPRSELIFEFLNWIVSFAMRELWQDKRIIQYVSVCPSKFDNRPCANWSMSCFVDSLLFLVPFRIVLSHRHRYMTNSFVLRFLWNPDSWFSTTAIHDSNGNEWHSHRAVWWYRSNVSTVEERETWFRARNLQNGRKKICIASHCGRCVSKMLCATWVMRWHDNRIPFDAPDERFECLLSVGVEISIRTAATRWILHLAELADGRQR